MRAGAATEEASAAATPAEQSTAWYSLLPDAPLNASQQAHWSPAAQEDPGRPHEPGAAPRMSLAERRDQLMRENKEQAPLYAWEGIRRLDASGAGAPEGEQAFNWYADGLHREATPPPARSIDEVRLHQAAMRALGARQYTEALDRLWEGMQRYPDNQLFPTTAGTLYLRLKIPAKARECLERALAINEDNPVATVALARLYGVTREPTRARELFAKVTQARPPPPQRARAPHPPQVTPLTEATTRADAAEQLVRAAGVGGDGSGALQLP